MTTGHLYKILPQLLFDQALAANNFLGSVLDLKDGFIHLSTPAQVRETARLHFAGQNDLLLVALDAEALKQNLRWEPSRGGQLFPHYYGELSPQNFIWAKPLPWNGTGHEFPLEAQS